MKMIKYGHEMWGFFLLKKEQQRLVNKLQEPNKIWNIAQQLIKIQLKWAGIFYESWNTKFNALFRVLLFQEWNLLKLYAISTIEE